jgi:hypothetical protein
MRLPNTAHTSRAWRIHQLTGDYRLEDLWGLSATGGPDDFGRLVQGLAAADPSQSPSGATRALFAIRWTARPARTSKRSPSPRCT